MPQFSFSLLNVTQELDYNAIKAVPISNDSAKNSSFSQYMQQQSQTSGNSYAATAKAKSSVSNTSVVQNRGTGTASHQASTKSNGHAPKTERPDAEQAVARASEHEKPQQSSATNASADKKASKSTEVPPDSQQHSAQDSVNTEVAQSEQTIEAQAQTDESDAQQMLAENNSELSEDTVEQNESRAVNADSTFASDDMLALLAKSNQFEFQTVTVVAPNTNTEAMTDAMTQNQVTEIDANLQNLMKALASGELDVEQLTPEQQALIKAQLLQSKPVKDEHILPVKPILSPEQAQQLLTKLDTQLKPGQASLVTDEELIQLDPREVSGFDVDKYNEDPEQHIWQKQQAQLAPKATTKVEQSEPQKVYEQTIDLPDELLAKATNEGELNKTSTDPKTLVDVKASMQAAASKPTVIVDAKGQQVSDTMSQKLQQTLAQSASEQSANAQITSAEESEQSQDQSKLSANNAQAIAENNKQDINIKTSHLLNGTQLAQEQSQQTELEQHNAMRVEQASTKAVDSHQTQQKTQLQQLQQALNLHRKDVTDGLKDKVMVMIQQRIQQVDIRLDPPELGQMQVKVNMHQDGAQVSFVVNNPQAKDMLEQHMSRLREMLQQQGVNVADANVEQQKQQMKQQQQQTDFAGNGGSGKNTNAADKNNEEIPITHILESELVKASATGVDYYA